ncbi:MAG: cobyrinic acid a,c-diamide synthase [Deltaproteobacteria bacterium]|nr:MAG: cobyrinic acid a,c-diamide synthase [Deltaproteobacteria bacterium]
MARKIFIAATGQNCGKTTTSLSLMHLAQKKYARVGFIKPVGPKPVKVGETWADKDAALIAGVYGMERQLPLMSPVVLQPETTRQLLDGKLPAAVLEEQLLRAVHELDRSCDFLIVEGAGHSGVGSVLGLSNARVAKLIGAPVMMISGGGIGHVIDDVALNLALYREAGASVRLVMPNKLIAEKRDRTLHYLGMAAAPHGVKVHGGFNYSPILAGPTLQHIAKLLDLKLRATREQGLRIIHHVHLGAASAQKVVEMLEPNTLLLVTSSRDELLVLMASLYHIPEYRAKLVGIVIPGLSPVASIVQEVLDDSELPFMRIARSTAEVFRTINEDVSKITAEDTEKISLVQHLAEEQIDFDFIDAQLD